MSKPQPEPIHRRLARAKHNRLDVFRRLSEVEQAVALLRVSPRLQREIMSQLGDAELLQLLTHLDFQQTTTLLRRIDSKRAGKVLSQLNKTVRDKVEYLLRFNPRAAAGLMNLNFVSVGAGSSFRDVSKALEDEEKASGKFPTILVMEGGHLLGELPGHELVWGKPTEHILKKVKRISTLPYDTPEREVMQAFLRHEHGKLAVVDENKAVLGVISTDDILPLIRDHGPGGLYKFAGVTREEDAYDSALLKVKYRYKWLIINLGTAFLAASVVGLFEDILSKFVLLAIYMPIVAGMGGNAGTQSMAVAVRALTLKEIDLHTARSFVINEMLAGAANGAINGVIVAAVATVFNQSPMLGLVLGIAMVINLLIAGLAGALIPIIMKQLGKDPASSATIFITTCTDVFGFFVFLGLATILL
jgi:magnesium transporter